MSLIEKEKEILHEIAITKHSESIKKNYLNSDWKDESYYESPLTDSYLEIYQFDTPIEMRKILEDFFKKMDLPDEFLPVVLAAAFKLKNKNLEKEVIMETIYNF